MQLLEESDIFFFFKKESLQLLEGKIIRVGFEKTAIGHKIDLRPKLCNLN